MKYIFTKKKMKYLLPIFCKRREEEDYNFVHKELNIRKCYCN